MADDKKKGDMFTRIETREDAIKVAKDVGAGFFVIAAIQGGIGVFLAPSMLVDAAIFAICGYFVRSKQSRAAAVIALVLSGIGFITTFMNKMGEMVGGGNHIFLAIIIALAAIRAVEATFKLNGRFKAVLDVPKNTQSYVPADGPRAALGPRLNALASDADNSKQA